MFLYHYWVRYHMNGIKLTLKFNPVFKEYLSIPILLKSISFETSITIAIKKILGFHSKCFRKKRLSRSYTTCTLWEEEEEKKREKIWSQRDARPYSISICDYAFPKIRSRPSAQSANVFHLYIHISLFYNQY